MILFDNKEFDIYTKSTMDDLYVGYAKEEEIVNSSSSGGLFFILASFFIEKNGVIYGCIIDDNGYAKHIRGTTLTDVDKMKESKYVESKIDQTLYKQFKNDVLNGLNVLFVGTPCQIAVIRHLIEINKLPNDHVLLVDFVCHGTPQLQYWKQFLKEKKISGNASINFRDKKNGWENYSLSINNKIITNNCYHYYFLNNYILCKQCYSCNFKGVNHKSDITLGDAWGISKYNVNYCSNGTSLLLFHTMINDQLFDYLLKNAFIEKIDYDYLIKNNPSYYQSSTKPSDYDSIINSINTIGMHKTYNKILRRNKKQIRKAKIKSIIINLVSLYAPYFFQPIIKKKKIAIYTLYSPTYVNFGNRLQNFALHYSIRKMGYKTINICFENDPNLRINDTYISLFFSYLKKKKYAHKNLLFKKAAIKTKIKNDWIKNTPLHSKKILKYRTIIFGGDQLWNPNLPNINLKLGNTTANLNTIRKYSFACSICDYKNDANIKSLFYNSLKTFDSVSVREKEGTNYLSSLGINSRLDLDPVFLLNKDEWQASIIKYKSISLPNYEYAFKYILSSDKNVISSDIQLIDVLNDNQHEYFNINYFDFAYLIANANEVHTDSYHAFLFSIIFRKKIYLYKRTEENMKDRFSSLLEILSLPTQQKYYDFSKFNPKKLDYLISKSQQYLLNIVLPNKKLAI